MAKVKVIPGTFPTLDKGARYASVAQAIRVEGKYWTIQQIAAELGVTRQTAGERLRNAQVAPGPVTWTKLRKGL